MTTDTTHPATTAAAPPQPTPIPKAVLCPYCGHLSLNTQRCESCRGYFDPLSRQASQNSMGPWFIRDEGNPFRPGCSFDTLCSLVRRGKITHETVIRGPSTRQFWTSARSVPGLAHLLGECHNCHSPAAADDAACRACGADFRCDGDRQHLGLAPVHLLPGHTSPEIIAAASLRTPLAPAAAAPQVVGPAALPRDLLTPALERVTHSSSRRRSEAVPLWVGILVGAALLTTLIALVVNGASPRAGRGAEPAPAPTAAAGPAIQPAVEQAPTAPPTAEPTPAESAPIPDAMAPRPDEPTAPDIAALLAQPGGAGLPAAEHALGGSESADQSPKQAGFLRVLEARRAQLRLSAAL